MTKVNSTEAHLYNTLNVNNISSKNYGNTFSARRILTALSKHSPVPSLCILLYLLALESNHQTICSGKVNYVDS